MRRHTGTSILPHWNLTYLHGRALWWRDIPFPSTDHVQAVVWSDGEGTWEWELLDIQLDRPLAGDRAGSLHQALHDSTRVAWALQTLVASAPGRPRPAANDAGHHQR